MLGLPWHLTAESQVQSRATSCVMTLEQDLPPALLRSLSTPPLHAPPVPSLFRFSIDLLNDALRASAGRGMQHALATYGWKQAGHKSVSEDSPAERTEINASNCTCTGMQVFTEWCSAKRMESSSGLWPL
jgi:hypothetical protein